MQATAWRPTRTRTGARPGAVQHDRIYALLADDRLRVRPDDRRAAARGALVRASVPAVSPIIEAAWIAAVSAGTVGVVGIAGAVVTSIVSSRNTAKATTQTVEAGVASTAAKRAAAYEETIAGLLYRQEKRQHDLRMYRLDEESERRLKDFFASYEPPGWFEAQARLVAYASDEVRHASDATQQADREVSERYRQWATLGDDNRRAVESGNPGAAHDGETTMQAYRAIGPALEEAEVKDQALIGAIRDELRSKPEAALAITQTPAASHHKLWHRRRA
jgi:hypothetical protein